jgi:dTDP-4-amino-4,6-dideoxygalactose transaminase
MFKRFPPVGTLFPLRTTLKAFKASPDAVSVLERRMVELFEGHAAFSFNSGRAALTAALRMIAQTRRGKGVIVPAYFCYSVAAAIAKAGMRIFPADVLPETLSYDYKDRVRPSPSDVVAVVSPGLFGIPGDIPELQRICRPDHLFVIEDAAQTLGASIDGKPAGSFGDVSLFSFGRGKPLGGLGGGVLVTRGRAISESMKAGCALPDPRAPWKSGLESFAAAAVLRPGLFSIVRLMPFIRFGGTVFDPDFVERGLDAGRAALITELLKIREQIFQVRLANGKALHESLDGIEGILIPKPRSGITHSYLRFPLIFEDPADRDAALFRLTTKGLGASTMYPKPLHKVEKAGKFLNLELRPFPGAEKVARGIMTLPTQASVGRRDINKIVKIIREVMAAGA